MSLYKVITTSKLQQGVEPKQAILRLGKLLNLSPEKSKNLLKKPVVFKKGINAEEAKKLRLKLEKAGLEVKIKTMEEVKKPTKKAPQPAKLETVQMERISFETKTTPSQSLAGNSNENNNQHYHKPHQIAKPSFLGSITLLSIILCLLATVLGSAIWASPMVVFKIEYGIATISIATVVVAMVIAGASALGKSRGFIAGLFCALLLVISVLGGKFVEYSYKEYVHFGEQQMALAQYRPDMDNIAFAFMINDYTSGKVNLTHQTDGQISSKRPKLEKGIIEFKKAKFEDYYVKNLTSEVDVIKKTMSTSSLDLIRRNFDEMGIIILIIGMLVAFGGGFGRKP